jgi:hypothetical protein
LALEVPGTLFALADVVIEYGACACLLHPLTAQFGTTRTSGDVRLESEKQSRADIEQTLLNDRTHRSSSAQYDLTVRYGITPRYFYVRGEYRSFHTTKTRSCHSGWLDRTSQRGGKPTSLRRAKSPRPRAVRGRLSRPLAGKLLAVGLSEDPPDDFVGMCIETSAMAEQNTLRLP